MKEEKIIIDPFVLDKITNSNQLTNKEKINFLKYIWYMTNTEKRELIQYL